MKFQYKTRHRNSEPFAISSSWTDYYTKDGEHVVIAPSANIATAWLEDRYPDADLKIIAVTEEKFSAFIHEHAW